MKKLLLLLFICAYAVPVVAIDTGIAFDDPELQARYEHIISEVRCLKCQNQTIKDSNAFLAGDLRKPKGLFIGLHGGGVDSANAAGAHSAYSGQAGARDWLAIFPQAIAATERGWTDTGTEEWIMDLIDQARRNAEESLERRLAESSSQAKVMALSTGQRNLAAALLIAAGSFGPDTFVMTMVAVVTLTAVMMIIAAEWGRRAGADPEPNS